jgi:CoA:oxalate CoA-transferase
MALLSGIRVVSIEQFIAGPYCSSILADMGAEVLKVERPVVGDPRRTYQPTVPTVDGESLSAGFIPYNRGKRSIELDYLSEEGSNQLGTLLEDADVLICNMRPGALARAAWPRERIRSAFPRLVYCEITGFGTTGPYADWPALDSVVQAMSGLSGLIGATPQSPPGLAPMSTMDLLAGVYASVGILAGLQGRTSTGEGCHIDASMYDIGAAFLARPLTLLEFTGVEPSRGLDEFSPVGAFPAGDSRWVSIVIPTTDMWRRTCRAIGRLDLLDDARTASNELRAENMHTVIEPALADWASSRTADECAAALRDAGQPAGVVQSMREVRDCPHLAARELFIDLDNVEPTKSVPRFPLLFNGTFSAPTTVPALGEGNPTFLSKQPSTAERAS